MRVTAAAGHSPHQAAALAMLLLLRMRAREKARGGQRDRTEGRERGRERGRRRVAACAYKQSIRAAACVLQQHRQQHARDSSSGTLTAPSSCTGYAAPAAEEESKGEGERGAEGTQDRGRE